jgi:two-component system sensor kinase FixL
LSSVAETELDATEFRRQRDLILAATGDGIYGVDTSGTSQFVNPAAARMSGYTIEEMIGVNLHALIHHSRNDGRPYHVHDCPIYAAAKDGKIHRVSDEVFWRKDGSCYPVEYISTPIWDEGELVGAVVSFRDITDRKQADLALRESEARYRAMFDDSSAAVFLFCATSRKIKDSNKQTSLLLDYEVGGLEGTPADDLFVGRPGDLAQFFEQVVEHGSAETEALCCRTKSGATIPVRVSASTLQLNDGPGILVLANDISRRTKAEDHARQLQSELHHVSRLSAMGEMATAMAHELNQPLSAVMNYVQAARRLMAVDSDEKTRDYMDKAINQAGRAADIIRGLRSFVAKGDAESAFEDINEIISEAIALTLPGAKAAMIGLQTDFAEDMPPVLVERVKIQQVVVNLVRNAVEAMAETPHPSLIVKTAAVADGMIEVQICDCGPGLTDEQVELVFQSFMTTKQQGMGVGLSICRSIIEGHDGKLWASHNRSGGRGDGPGGGAVFHFTLPVISDEDGFDG